MNSSTEDLVRQAFERQAELAVDPDRIRAALPVRAARRARTRRYGAVAAFAVAVTAVAAIAVPAIVVRGGLGDPAQTGAPVQPGAPVTLGEIPLRYRITWLPPGLTERGRLGQVGGSGDDGQYILRSWVPGSDADGPQLYLSVGPASGGPDQAVTAGTLIDINGRAGSYTGDSGKSVLQWSPDQGTVITVGEQGLNLSQQDLVRVARSVQPDQTRLTSPVRVGWVPAGITVRTVDVSGASPAQWRAAFSGEQLSGVKGEERLVEVSYGTTAGAPERGQSMTLNGRQAWYLAGVAGDMSSLVVDFGQGRFLTVSGSGPQRTPISKDDLVRIAGNTEVDPEPDVSWIGGR